MIAEVPARIEQAILTTSCNSAEVFAAQVYIKGIPKIVTIDDYLLYGTNGKEEFDIQGSDGSLWGPLLEKAWAKVSGNFQFAWGGSPNEVYSLFLGCPSTLV
jgi:hypothetical protein